MWIGTRYNVSRVQSRQLSGHCSLCIIEYLPTTRLVMGVSTDMTNLAISNNAESFNICSFADL